MTKVSDEKEDGLRNTNQSTATWYKITGYFSSSNLW